jgi:transcriptional regulator GlxA family with amidase domain
MTSTGSAKPTIHVAVLLFPQADVLDFAGPIEVLSHATHHQNRDVLEPIFAVETAGRAKDVPIPTGSSTLAVQPSIHVAQLLETLPKYHVLIVPGGPQQVMQRVMDMDDQLEVRVIKAFAQLPPAEDGRERIILSVCTGAFLLGAAGVLSGLKVTTHHMAVDQLRALCDASNAGNGAETKTEVVQGQRFIDAGTVKDGLRIVTAGGVSSGLDATLHLVELVKNRETADFISKIIEYERRQV